MSGSSRRKSVPVNAQAVGRVFQGNHQVDPGYIIVDKNGIGHLLRGNIQFHGIPRDIQGFKKALVMGKGTRLGNSYRKLFFLAVIIVICDTDGKIISACGCRGAGDFSRTV